MLERGISPDTLQSFWRSQELLTAINALSIHTKLERLGITDEERVEPSQKAKETLSGFLSQLEKVVHEVEQGKDEPLIGVSPRFGQLARNFVAARTDKERKWCSDLVISPLPETIRLVNSSDEKDRPEKIAHLSDLRILIEKHIAVDARQILTQI